MEAARRPLRSVPRTLPCLSLTPRPVLEAPLTPTSFTIMIPGRSAKGMKGPRGSPSPQDALQTTGRDLDTLANSRF